MSSAEKAKRSEAALISSASAAALAPNTPLPPLAVVFQQAAPALEIGRQVINVVGPAYMHTFRLAVWAYETAPLDLIQAATGLGLCFFGGAFCASIAAVEAFNLATWSTTRAALEEIYADVLLIVEANEADEKKDEDGAKGAGTKLDVSQRTPAERAQRKLRIALMAVRDPQKLSIAVGGLYAGWLAVIGTLRLQFAKTVTLGVSIAEMLDGPALRVGVPALAHLTPAEFHRWLPVAIRTLMKLIIISFAWYMQVVISALQSAMRGGLMCSKAMLRWAKTHGLVEHPHGMDDTHAAEIFGYALAAAGCYMQWRWGFAAPFPLNIALLPFSLVEWYIRYAVTGGPL